MYNDSNDLDKHKAKKKQQEDAFIFENADKVSFDS